MQFTIANAQWQNVSVNTNSILKDVCLINDNIGFVVGGGDAFNTPNNTDGVIFKTIDSGNSWFPVFTQSNTSINYVVNINNKIIAFGSDSNTSYEFVSSDNGTTWQNIPLTYSVWDVRTAGNIIFFKDNYLGATLKKTENGITSIVANGIGTYGVNANELVYTNYTYDTIFKSTDYGNTFLPLNEYPTEFSQNQSTEAVIKSFGDTIVVHYTYPNATQFSLDNSNTWTLLYDGVNGSEGANYCEIVSNNLLIGSFNNELNAQINFQPWENQVVLTDKIRRIYIYDENLGFAVGDNGMIYKTTNVEGLSTNNVSTEKKKIRIIPNPATDILFIENTGNISIKSVVLFELSGKKIKSFPENVQQLDISNLSGGMYILKISTENASYSEKIIKK